MARSLDRLRGFDRFLNVASTVLQARADVVFVVVGDRVVRRGLDVLFHNRDYAAQLMASHPKLDADRLMFLGLSAPAVVADVLAASDLHLAPSRPYPVARSVLEAMAAGLFRRGLRHEPHREIIATGQTGLLVDGRDTDGLARQVVDVLADPARYRRVADAAAARCVSGMPRTSVCRGSPSG